MLLLVAKANLQEKGTGFSSEHLGKGEGENNDKSFSTDVRKDSLA